MEEHLVLNILLMPLKGNADAIAIASMLHYSKKINSLRNTINIKNEGNTEFLKRNIGFKNFEIIFTI